MELNLNYFILMSLKNVKNSVFLKLWDKINLHL